jgi:hypothetical protein
MPVLECSCGMVMSVSVAKPRNTCIRCGGMDFREMQHFDLVVNAIGSAPLVPITTCGNGLRISMPSSAGEDGSPTAVGCT